MTRSAISDGHSHIAGKVSDPEPFIPAMDRNNVDRVVLWSKSKKEGRDGKVLSFQSKYPGRVIAGAGFQNRGWRDGSREFIEEIRGKAASEKFKWLGEISFRGKLGGKLHSSPGNPLWREVMDIAASKGLPITIHHNPYAREGEGFRRTEEFEQLGATEVKRTGHLITAYWKF